MGIINNHCRKSMELSHPTKLETPFFAQNCRIVAHNLLGKVLVHDLEGAFLAGKIVEVEAYCDFHKADLACHGSKNKGRPTKRTMVMFGEAGHAYVYLNYGIHWLFNVVTGEIGSPSAVLIRALEPLSGLDRQAIHRKNQPFKNWTNGPGKLTQAMGINQSLNGQNLCRPNSVIWIEDHGFEEVDQIVCGPRIGLGKTPEPWLSMPWRYWIKNNQFVSV